MPKQKQNTDLMITIEQNRKKLTEMLSGTDTCKRLNNLNWLRHEMSYSEPRTLFTPPPGHKASDWLDYTYMKNTEAAYDKIATFFCAMPDATNKITIEDVYDIHRILTNNTNMQISGGILRDNTKILNIRQKDGTRIYAPDACIVKYQLKELIYNLNTSTKKPIVNAFNVHYEMIMLQPFEDFNKRTARAVMNMYLVQNGYQPVVFNGKKDRPEYIDAIAARANGDTGAYMQYMMNCTVRTQPPLINIIKKSRIL